MRNTLTVMRTVEIFLTNFTPLVCLILWSPTSGVRGLVLYGGTSLLRAGGRGFLSAHFMPGHVGGEQDLSAGAEMHRDLSIRKITEAATWQLPLSLLQWEQQSCPRTAHHHHFFLSIEHHHIQLDNQGLGGCFPCFFASLFSLIKKERAVQREKTNGWRVYRNEQTTLSALVV